MPYTPINPTEAYDESRFKTETENLGFLEGGLEALSRDPNNGAVIGKLGEVLRQNPSFYASQMNPTLKARTDADGASREGRKNLDDYVLNNADSIFGLLGDENLIGDENNPGLLSGTKLQESAGDDEYNAFVKAANERADAHQASESPQKRAEYVIRKMKESSTQNWMKNSFGLFGDDSTWIQRLFQDYLMEAENTFRLQYTDKEGNVDNEKLRNYARTALYVAKNTGDKDFFSALGQVAGSKLLQDNPGN